MEQGGHVKLFVRIKMQQFQVKRVILNVYRMEKMVHFYQFLFEVKFNKSTFFNSTLYSGYIAGIPVTLFPNSIAKINAEHNRHQFEYYVNDIEFIYQKVKTAGGEIKTPISSTRQGRQIHVLDPDKNTLVFTEKRISDHPNL